jgi:hypothetical protein
MDHPAVSLQQPRQSPRSSSIISSKKGSQLLQMQQQNHRNPFPRPKASQIRKICSGSIGLCSCSKTWI